MNILIVDDHAQNLYLLQTLLVGHGHRVESAANGLEALARLESGGIEMIVSDLLMPGMDGFELCRRVKADERWRRLPFVVYTATYTSADDERFVRSLGADEFLLKPLAPDAFLDAIEELVQGARARPADAAATPPAGDEDYYREYNVRLIRKLEQKLLALEQAHEATRRSEQRFHAAARMAPAGLLQLSPTGAVDFANDEWRRLAGADAERGSWLDAVHSDDRPEVAAAWAAALARGKPFAAEFRLRAGDLRVQARAAPFADERGESLGLMAVFSDVTELRALESVRRELRERVEQSVRSDAQGKFLAGLGTELGGALQAAAGYGELLARSELAGPSAEDLAGLRQALAKGQALAKQLAAFAKGAPESFAPQAVAPLLAAALLARQVGLPPNVRLDARIAESLPDALCDGVRLRAAFRRLLDHAVEAVRPRGGVVEAALEVRRPQPADLERLPELRDQDCIVAIVRDNGPVRPPSDLARMFEPFKGSGAGGEALEMAAVHATAWAHGGGVEALGRPGGGVEFRLWIPALPAARAPEPPSGPARLGKGERVLMVEPDAATRALVQRMLDRLGYAASAYSDSPAALAAFEARPSRFDLALLAADLPDHGCRELADRLWQRRPGLPIAVVAGETDALAADPDDRYAAVVAKPLGMLGLASALGRVFARRD